MEPLQKPMLRMPAVRVTPPRCSRTPVVSVPSSVVSVPTVATPAAVRTFVAGAVIGESSETGVSMTTVPSTREKLPCPCVGARSGERFIWLLRVEPGTSVVLPKLNGCVKVSVPGPVLTNPPAVCATSQSIVRSLSICHTTAPVDVLAVFVTARVHVPPAGPA